MNAISQIVKNKKKLSMLWGLCHLKNKFSQILAIIVVLKSTLGHRFCLHTMKKVWA